MRPAAARCSSAWNPVQTTPLVGFNGPEHSHLQLPASILGQNIARYFIWNGIRGIDVLCSLPKMEFRPHRSDREFGRGLPGADLD